MLPVTPPIFSPAPMVYSQDYINSIVSELENLVTKLNTNGLVVAKTMQITDLPTSSAGLPAGSLWNDSGTVKVV